VLEHGRIGETYNIGGRSERTNLQVVDAICSALDTLAPRPGARPHAELITHVKDRPGHDRRYAIDDSKIAKELGWQPSMSFEAGMRQTIEWYLGHQEWVESVTSGSYRQWVEQHYGSRARQP
jgi:dTDP-glucose 4,6-dehydratase